jgi:hypothetical protein
MKNKTAQAPSDNPSSVGVGNFLIAEARVRSRKKLDGCPLNRSLRQLSTPNKETAKASFISSP